MNKNNPIFRFFKQVDYSLCNTYPQFLVFPYSASDDLIRGSATLRSASRLPALTWFDKNKGVSIWRCS